MIQANLLNSIEIAFGVLACIGVLVSWFGMIDAIRVRRYQAREHINGLQARYGRERMREELLSVIIEAAMGLAAAAALIQNAEPGPQPNWASVLLLSLCVAQILFVAKIIMRRLVRRRMLAALARAEAAAKKGGSA